MHERRAYMRIYWSGALYFLEADIALRETAASGTGANSLDEVLRIYDECCLTSYRRSGLRMAQEFDRIADRTLFVPLFKSYQESTSIPDYEPLMGNPIVAAIFGS